MNHSHRRQLNPRSILATATMGGPLVFGSLSLSVFVAFTLLTSDLALAFIPATQMILARTTRADGKGVFTMDQEIEFHVSELEPQVLREHWVIENGDALRLTVSGGKGKREAAQMDALYRDGSRHYVDGQGNVRNGQISVEFIEPFLHYRSGRALLEAFVHDHILPSSAIREHAQHLTKIENWKYTPDPYVHLSRFGGVVTFAFGEPTPVNAEKLNPGAWIEQDAFFLRRVRFPSQAEVVADGFATFAGNSHFPRERTVSWDNNTVTIKVLSVHALGESASAKAQLGLQTLKSARPLNLPDVPQIREFYARFR